MYIYLYIRRRVPRIHPWPVDKRGEDPGATRVGGGARSPVLFIGRVDNMCASPRNTHTRAL